MGQVVTGNRAKVYVNGNLVGIFDSCSYSTSLLTEDIWILGSSLAQEIAITGQDVVNLNCSGFRVVNFGVHTLPAVPRIADLLSFEALTITVVDRQTNTTVLTVVNCTPTSENTNYNAKATSRISVSYRGLRYFSEEGDSTESGAASLPS